MLNWTNLISVTFKDSERQLPVTVWNSVLTVRTGGLHCCYVILRDEDTELLRSVACLKTHSLQDVDTSSKLASTP